MRLCSEVPVFGGTGEPMQVNCNVFDRAAGKHNDAFTFCQEETSGSAPATGRASGSSFPEMVLCC